MPTSVNFGCLAADKVHLSEVRNRGFSALDAAAAAVPGTVAGAHIEALAERIRVRLHAAEHLG